MVFDFCVGHFGGVMALADFCYIFDRIDLKFCRMFCHDLKICI